MIGNETDSDDVALQRLFDDYRTFLQSSHRLMRYLVGTLPKHGWTPIKSRTGQGVTRNGWKGALAKFDWLLDSVGISFIRSDVGVDVATSIPSSGVEILAFQLRIHDRSPNKPVVWRARLHVELVNPPGNWRNLQAQAFEALRSDSNESNTSDGAIAPITVNGRSAGRLKVTGTWHEVPVSLLRARQDVDQYLLKL